MANRQWNPDMLQEEWFVALTTEYKWLYLWAFGYATQAGVWKPAKLLPLKRYYMNGMEADYNDFIEKVNTNQDGSTARRLRLLPNGNLFFEQHFVQQLGNYFKPKVDAHRDALKVLLDNGIPLTDIAGFQWLGIEDTPFFFQCWIANDKTVLDLEESLIKRLIREIRNHTDETWNWIQNMKKYPQSPVPDFSQQSQPKPTGTDGTCTELQQPLSDTDKKIKQFFGGKRIATSFNSRRKDDPAQYHPVADVYTTWKLEDLINQPSSFKRYTEEGFNLWREWCRYVVAQNLIHLLNPQYFLSISDMCQMLEQHITRAHWNKLVHGLVTQKLHFGDNLYFKILALSKHIHAGQNNAATNKGKRNNGNNDSAAGQDFNNMTTS